VVVVAVDYGEAAAVDGDAGGNDELVGERGGVNREFAACARDVEAGDGAEVFDDAGEHEGSLAGRERVAIKDPGNVAVLDQLLNLTKI